MSKQPLTLEEHRAIGAGLQWLDIYLASLEEKIGGHYPLEQLPKIAKLRKKLLFDVRHNLQNKCIEENPTIPPKERLAIYECNEKFPSGADDIVDPLLGLLQIAKMNVGDLIDAFFASSEDDKSDLYPVIEELLTALNTAIHLIHQSAVTQPCKTPPQIPYCFAPGRKNRPFTLEEHRNTGRITWQIANQLLKLHIGLGKSYPNQKVSSMGIGAYKAVENLRLKLDNLVSREHPGIPDLEVSRIYSPELSDDE